MKQFQAWLQQRNAHWLCVSTKSFLPSIWKFDPIFSMHPETKLEVRCFYRSRPDTPTRNASNGDLQGHKETGANPTHWRAQHWDWVNSLRSLHFACVHCAATQLHAIHVFNDPIAVSSKISCQVTTARKLVDGVVFRARDDEKAATGNFNQSCAWTSSENLIYYIDLCMYYVYIYIYTIHMSWLSHVRGGRDKVGVFRCGREAYRVFEKSRASVNGWLLAFEIVSCFCLPWPVQ